MESQKQKTLEAGHVEFPERWSTTKLKAAVPGTSSAWWLNHIIPRLEAAGVLTRVGSRWLGRRSEIVKALLTAASVTATGE